MTGIDDVSVAELHLAVADHGRVPAAELGREALLLTTRRRPAGRAAR